MKIININWDNTYLHLYLDKASKFIRLVDLLNKDIAPFIKVDDKHFKINIINLENVGAILDGKYKIVDDNFEELIVDDKLIYSLSNLDRGFPYKHTKLLYIKLDIDKLTKTLIINANYYKENKDYKKKSLSTSKDSFFIKIFRNIYKFFIMIFYKIIRFFSFNKKQNVLFLTMNKNKLDGNLLALYNYMDEHSNYHLIKDANNIFDSKNPFKVIKTVFRIAKSNYIFIDNYTPIFNFLDLDKDVELIQLWHAGVGFKAVGYARFGKSGSPDPIYSSHRKYTKAIAGSDKLVETYQDVFGISKDKFIVSGLPRLDKFNNKANQEKIREDLYIKYPYFKDKKLILFAPTYRGDGQNDAYYPKSFLDLEKLDKFLDKKNYLLLFKMHPFVKNLNIDFNKYKNIIDFNEYRDINELLLVSNALVTDFSSNIYEAALFNVPIRFYAPDKNEYELIRGVHKRLDDFAKGDIAYNMGELIKAIDDLEIKKWQKEFRKEFVEEANSISCAIIVDEIFNKK